MEGQVKFRFGWKCIQKTYKAKSYTQLALIIIFRENQVYMNMKMNPPNNNINRKFIKKKKQNYVTTTKLIDIIL